MNLSDEVNPATPAAAIVMRIGVVQATPAPTANMVSVLVFEGTDPIRVTYLAPYVPVAGDVVEVLLLGGSSTSGIVIGGRGAQSGNLVVNPNFYRAPTLVFPPINAPPYHWFRYVASGSAGLFCQVFKPSVLRFIGNVAGAGGNTSGDTFTYSSAIPVTAGANYSLTTTGHASVFTNTTLTVQSRVAWFADPADDYPNFASETQFGSDTFGASTENDPYHTGTLTAPAGATHARLVLRNNFVTSGAGGGAGNMQWAEVVMLPA